MFVSTLYVLTVANCLSRPPGMPQSCCTSVVRGFVDQSYCTAAGLNLLMTVPAVEGRRVTASCGRACAVGGLSHGRPAA